MLVSLENKANEQEVHSSSSGITISSNPSRAAAGTLGANFGESSSRDTFLNDAYVHGAVDFMHSQVRNQGCLVMDISNSGASYEYVPGEEVHESTSFAIGLSGLDLTSADSFAYSLGRSLASSAASAGVGLVASRAGLGGFVSTIAASLAGTYVNTNLLPLQRNEQPTNHESRLPSITSNGTVSYERNGDGFQAINVDFDKAELDAIIDKIRENIFAEALDRGASPQEVAEAAQLEVANFGRDIETEQEKISQTANAIDQTENQLKEEVIESIGPEKTRDFKIKDLSPNDRKQVAESLSKAIKRLQKQQAKINLMAPKGQNLVQNASLQAQNEIISEKIQSYSFLCDFLLRSNSSPKLTRSNSADNLIQDTYIRQGQRALGMGIAGIAELSHEADVLSHQQYTELQRSRLPEDIQNNPDALGKLGASYAVYKAAAGVGHGLVALDDATGNVVSGGMHKLGDAFEWIGTHTRRFVRDDLGYSQRTAQNLGDATQIAAEIFNPGKVFAATGAVTKISGISKFKNKLSINYGLIWDSWSAYPKQIVDGTVYAKIGRRLYTEHAIGRMLPSGLGRNACVAKEGMSISPNFVEHVIRHGQKTEIIMSNGVHRAKYSLGTVEVYTENNGKLIITVNSLRGK